MTSVVLLDLGRSSQIIYQTKIIFRGSNIQVIKDKTGAFVYVDKENVAAQYAGRCIIRGNSVQVLAAEKRVQELLARRDFQDSFSTRSLTAQTALKNGAKLIADKKNGFPLLALDANQNIVRNYIDLNFMNNFYSLANRKLVSGMKMKIGPARKKQTERLNAMQRNESMTPFLFLFRQLEWLSAKKEKI